MITLYDCYLSNDTQTDGPTIKSVVVASTWESREKEHQDKVRLTLQDIADGNTQRAEERMNTGDGGLAKHSAVCNHQINWKGARIVGRERNTTQRKFLEGIETLKEKSKGKTPLNSYNNMEPWQPVIFEYLRTS